MVELNLQTVKGMNTTTLLYFRAKTRREYLKTQEEKLLETLDNIYAELARRGMVNKMGEIKPLVRAK
jgi:hypothetical protein